MLEPYGELDRNGASTNLAMATDIFVFDQDGRTLFSLGPDGNEGAVLDRAMPGGLTTLLRVLHKTVEASHMLEDGPVVLANFTGKLTLISARP